MVASKFACIYNFICYRKYQTLVSLFYIYWYNDFTEEMKFSCRYLNLLAECEINGGKLARAGYVYPGAEDLLKGHKR